MSPLPRLPKFEPPADTAAPDGKKPGGGGYQWIMDKFVQLAADIGAIREQTVMDEDQGDYRRLTGQAKALDAGGAAITVDLGAIPNGVEWRLERLVIHAAAAGVSIITVLSGEAESMDTLVDAFPMVARTVKEYANVVVLREGMHLIVRVLTPEAGQLPVEVTAFVRVIADKPQGLAVG